MDLATVTSLSPRLVFMRKAYLKELHETYSLYFFFFAVLGVAVLRCYG
jgi:hypothetical protein